MENLNNCIKFRDEQINAYKTIFKNYKTGSILNTEIDILAKYIEKLGSKE